MSTLASITIKSVAYPSYGTKAEADQYMASSSANAVAWAALDSTGKNRGLVNATRILSRIAYLGTAAASAQAVGAAFPRVGLVDRYGVPIADTVVPVEVCQANFELALDLEDGTSTVETSTTGPTQVRASSTREGPFSENVQNFFGGSDVDLSKRWPQIVTDLIGRWFALADVVQAYGATEESIFSPGQDSTTAEGLP